MKPRGFRQPRCAGCGLTGSGCVCALYPRLEGPIAVSVVMTRSEARSASNSARLLSLWLPGVELHVRGGADDPGGPEALLGRPGSALLFPGNGRAESLPEGVRHLIVPDGTWAQARRIERRWFAASGLPRVSLEGPWPSVYGLRRGGEGLCTFEAIALALGVLGQVPLAEALLGRFGEWARRAQRLKGGGGGPDTAAPMGPEPTQPHPAVRLLRALPPGTGDARLQLEAPSSDNATSEGGGMGSATPQRLARI
jgi:DTW domain-containing protein YfiP